MTRIHGPPASARSAKAATSRPSMADAQDKKKILGLDNPSRVQRIKDHGESLHLADHGGRRRPIKRPKGNIGLGETLEEILDEFYDQKNNLLYFSNPSMKFIPRDVFAKILTPERVFQIVSRLECFRHERDKQRLAQDVYYGTSNSPPYLKVLGILIGMKRVNELKVYMDERLSDKCLPLRYKYIRGGHGSAPRADKLVCRHSGHNHKTINEYRRDEMKDSFIDWTRRLMAPYIKWQDSLHSHYVFETGDCLPMTSCERKQSSDQAPSQPDAVTYGGFSDVYKVQICKSHCSFGQQRLRNPQGYYALKKLSSHSRENFNLELASLLFSADQGGRKQHLVQLLATFEEYNPLDRTSTYYLLFDWAQGDLTDFWKANPKLVRNKRHCLWMAEQFFGLAEALQIVHNDRTQNLQFLPEGSLDGDLYGRHGDIKPGNLLWFESSGISSRGPVLTLADFGLGRLHTKVSRSKQDPGILQRSATYRPPEFDLPDGLVSPVSDVFSLGCVFLEHISWFLLGNHAVLEEFPELRMEKDIYTILADTFFSVSTGPGGHAAPSLKPAVRAWIQRLREHPDCSWYLVQMLDLIENEMLEPIREKRIKAASLTKSLRTIMTTCQRNPSFYMNSSSGSSVEAYKSHSNSY